MKTIRGRKVIIIINKEGDEDITQNFGKFTRKKPKEGER